jgi:glycine/D-amino acid oxidase-like deaminating enzyme
MYKNKVKIGVIGAGIIGTSSALRLIESIPDIDITIIAEQWSPNTTGDGSAGLIYPYLMGKTSPQKISKWFRETIGFLDNHFWSSDGGKLGIGLLSMYVLFGENDSNERPEFADQLITYRDLTAKEIKLFPNKWKSGAFVTTYFAECTKLLPFMLQMYKSKVMIASKQ